MRFAINPSLNYIDIPESCVYELYRSTKEVLLPDARFHGHSCEAYICLAKTDKTVKAYVALLETGMKTVFVYTADHSTTVAADYPEVYRQAEAFIKPLGFVMEPVNLSFSPAMREVIIKGFRVMRPPPPKRQPLRQVKAVPLAEPGKLDQKQSVSPPLAVTPSYPPAELESLRRELASAKAAIAQITHEKTLLEQKASQEIADLKTSCQQAIDDKKNAAALFSAETKKIRQEESAAASSLAEKKKSAFSAELQRVTEAAKTTESRLQEELTALRLKVVQLADSNQTVIQRLAAAEAANAEQRQLFAADKDQLLSRLAAEESAALAATDKIATMALFETSWREGQQREEELCRNIDMLQSQLDLTTAELAKQQELGSREEELCRNVDMLQSQLDLTTAELAKLQELGSREEELCRNVDMLQSQLDLATAELAKQQETGRREEALQQKVTGLEQELTATQKKLALTAGKEVIPESAMAELQATQVKVVALENEYLRFASESREKEQDLLDTITAAEIEIDRLSREIETKSQVAEAEQSALRNELRKLAITASPAEPSPPPAADVTRAKLAPPHPEAVASSPIAATPIATAPEAPAITVAVPPEPALVPPAAAPAEAVALPLTDEEPDRPIVSDQTIISRLMNEFGSFAGSSGYAATEFSVARELTAVEYSDPAEILVLLYSSNTVQAVPDGFSIQRCKGYVIAARAAEVYSVYVAWYLTESKSVVICTPLQQPLDKEECIRVLQDAIAYFEIVGFMMELEELGESVHSYNKALQKIPALCRKIIKS